MQCLVEISRIYYEFLASHIEQMATITTGHITNDEEKVSVQAFEFWCSVAETETKLIRERNESFGYCERYLDLLFSVVKTCLLNRSEEKEQDEDTWNNTKASSSLLASMSTCTGERLILHVFTLISESLNDSSFKSRDSAILAFGSILETECAEKIRNIIPGALPKLLNMLNDPSAEVRATMAWAIKRLAEFHSESFTNKNDYDLLMNTILESMNSDRKVVLQLLDAINFLVTNLRPGYNSTSSLASPYMERLLHCLLSTAYTKDAFDNDYNIALGAFYTMGSIIDYAPLDTYTIVSDFFGNIFSAFNATLDDKNFNSMEAKYAYQTYIATVISACAAGGKVKLSKEDAFAVYELIKSSFEERQSVYEEGLMAVSSLALSVGPEFVSMMPDFLRYLLFALSLWNSVDVCRIAINCTSDLIRALDSNMSAFMPKITPVILGILEVIFILTF